MNDEQARAIARTLVFVAKISEISKGVKARMDAMPKKGKDMHCALAHGIRI